jgi:arylformamidase
MIYHHVTDWDDAYANGANIAGGIAGRGLGRTGAGLPGRPCRPRAAPSRPSLWQGRAQPGSISSCPKGTPKGLVVFVHGGFWMKLDKSFWSHLAAGPLAHGHAVAMPSYTLCPDIRISGIVGRSRGGDHNWRRPRSTVPSG